MCTCVDMCACMSLNGVSIRDILLANQFTPCPDMDF